MAQASTKATKAQVEKLKRANEQLKAENVRLRAHLAKKKTSFWRNLAIVSCVLLSVAVLMIGNVLFWAGSTLVNTDRYVETVQPLAANETIQTAIADYTANQFFNQVNVQGVVFGALPPRAGFLAPQLTTQLRNATQKTLQRTLASDEFQTLWTDTNRQAHETLITAIKSSKTTDGVIDLQDVYDHLSQSLKGTRLNFLTDKALPEKVGSITAIDAPWIPKARFAVDNMGWLKPVSLAMLAIFSATAIWLSRDRRRLIVVLAGVFVLSMAATLIAMQITQNRVAAHVQPAYQAAVGDAVGIILQPLSHQTVAILGFSSLAIIAVWLTGPYRRTKCAVSATRHYLTTPLHGLMFSTESTFTKWVAVNRPIIQWTGVAMVGLVMLSTRLSLGLVAVYGAVMLALVLAAEILAAPHSSGER